MPIVVVPARKSTRLTVAPLTALAVAVTAVAAPMLTVAPAVGLVSETVGATALEVTLTIAEVALAPFESTTLAVSDTLPVPEGVHAKE